MLDEIIDAVADANDVAPENLAIALEDHVDTDSIRSLAEHKSDSWALQFELPNHRVRVTGQGGIFVDGTQKKQFA